MNRIITLVIIAAIFIAQSSFAAANGDDGAFAELDFDKLKNLDYDAIDERRTMLVMHLAVWAMDRGVVSPATPNLISFDPLLAHTKDREIVGSKLQSFVKNWATLSMCLSLVQEFVENSGGKDTSMANWHQEHPQDYSRWQAKLRIYVDTLAEAVVRAMQADPKLILSVALTRGEDLAAQRLRPGIKSKLYGALHRKQGLARDHMVSDFIEMQRQALERAVWAAQQPDLRDAGNAKINEDWLQSVASEKQARADAAMRDLLEEEDAKPKKAAAKKPVAKKAVSAKKRSAAAEADTFDPVASAPKSAGGGAAAAPSLALRFSGFNIKFVASRILNWEGADMEAIRGFGPRYAAMSLPTLEAEKAYHNLSRLIPVLETPVLRDRYALPGWWLRPGRQTHQSLLLLAKVTRPQADPQFGVIEATIDERGGLYHLHFVPTGAEGIAPLGLFHNVDEIQGQNPADWHRVARGGVDIKEGADGTLVFQIEEVTIELFPVLGHG